jgi:hypothetical protein
MTMPCIRFFSAHPHTFCPLTMFRTFGSLDRRRRPAQQQQQQQRPIAVVAPSATAVTSVASYMPLERIELDDRNEKSVVANSIAARAAADAFSINYHAEELPLGRDVHAIHVHLPSQKYHGRNGGASSPAAVVVTESTLAVAPNSCRISDDKRVLNTALRVLQFPLMIVNSRCFEDQGLPSSSMNRVQGTAMFLLFGLSGVEICSVDNGFRARRMPSSSSNSMSSSSSSFTFVDAFDTVSKMTYTFVIDPEGNVFDPTYSVNLTSPQQLQQQWMQQQQQQYPAYS